MAQSRCFVTDKPQDNQRPTIDRRTGTDRRRRYSLQYFLDGGVERRQAGRDRRSDNPERRRGWVRDGRWHSVRLTIPEAKQLYALRLDPCGGAGEVRIEALMLKGASGETLASWP